MKHIAEVADEGVIEGRFGFWPWQLPKRTGNIFAAGLESYFWMFPFAFGELLEMNMPVIQKEDMIITDLCNASLQIVHSSRFINLYCINCFNVYGMLPKSNCNIPEQHLFMP